MTASHRAPVAVCTVTFNSAADLPGCLRAVASLDPPAAELVVVDCGSGDESVAVARRSTPRDLAARIITLGENRGFAAGMNEAIAASRAPWVLSLNPDARPTPSYVARLLARRERHPSLRVGALTGRLVRPASETSKAGRPIVDACGMRLSPTWRHLDRGSGEPDRGQLQRPQRVFGATGAASLFWRQALLDAAIDGEVFDPRFHSFREDAELCFRLQERGWDVLYEPSATAVHRRFNLPMRRSAMPPEVNYHSLKNRYLLRLYHQRPLNLLWTLPATMGRDLLALSYVIMRERSSARAYAWLWRHRAEILRRRRLIQTRRRHGSGGVERWFLCRSLPLRDH